MNKTQRNNTIIEVADIFSKNGATLPEIALISAATYTILDRKEEF